MSFFRKLASRLREPSSLAGLSMLAVLCGAKVEEAQAVTTVIATVLGAAAVLVPEQKPPLLVVKGA